MSEDKKRCWISRKMASSVKELLERDSSRRNPEADPDEAVTEPGLLPYERKEGGLYPKVDLGIWLRSCVKEQER